MQEIANIDQKQFLVFRLAKEEYGVDIQKVTTIIEKNMSIARVPKTPEYIKGVINLRGEIVPVMDLRKKFSLSEIDDTEDTRIIIIKIDEIAIGLIVDSVVEVLYLADDAIENIASISTSMSMDYIFGVGKIQDRIVTILNLEKLIGIGESK